MGMDMMNVERLAAGKPLHEFMEAFRFGLGYSSGGIKASDVYGAAAYLPFFNAHAKMEARFAASVAVLRELAADMVERTRNGEIGGPDSMLTAMLQEKSPATGRVVRYSQFYGHIVNVMVGGVRRCYVVVVCCLLCCCVVVFVCAWGRGLFVCCAPKNAHSPTQNNTKGRRPRDDRRDAGVDDALPDHPPRVHGARRRRGRRRHRRARARRRRHPQAALFGGASR